MSQENVELVRRIYDAWERKESAREFIAADLEYVNPSYAVEPGVLRRAAVGDRGVARRQDAVHREWHGQRCVVRRRGQQDGHG